MAGRGATPPSLISLPSLALHQLLPYMHAGPTQTHTHTHTHTLTHTHTHTATGTGGSFAASSIAEISILERCEVSRSKPVSFRWQSAVIPTLTFLLVQVSVILLVGRDTETHSSVPP